MFTVSPDQTWMLRIIAQDPSVRVGRRIVTAQVTVPAEQLGQGPWGHRVQVIDYDATSGAFYQPLRYAVDGNGRLVDAFARASDASLLGNPQFHSQNVYAIVMRTLAAFERALGRRLQWGFYSHQLKVVPHAFEEANAFYSENDQGLFFGYFQGERGPVYTCLSHDIIAHETAHALLDGLRQRFTDPSSADQAGFHEGFADVVALLSIFQLPEVVGLLLAQASPGGRTKGTVPRSFLRSEEFVRRVLFGLGEELGRALAQVPGRALRMSYTVKPPKGAYTNPEYLESHRRGELLVAAMLRAFVQVWHARLQPLGRGGRGPLDRERVVEEGASAASHLLNMAIRALDYTPPVHLTFRDYLSALLTADQEIQPDDQKYQYRKLLRRSFEQWGIRPAAERDPARAELAPREPGLWSRVDGSTLNYCVRSEALRRDPDEVFRFIWENQDALKLHKEAFSRVLSVRPCRRIAPDGAPVQETVVEFYQILELTRSEQRRLELPPELLKELSSDSPLRLIGGGTLIFDDFGRLKYYVHNSVANMVRQSERLAYWLQSPWRAVPVGRRFEELHRMRALETGRRNNLECW